jgi:hypothetical protein
MTHSQISSTFHHRSLYIPWARAFVGISSAKPADRLKAIKKMDILFFMVFLLSTR